jgi:hypothetical protein
MASEDGLKIYTLRSKITLRNLVIDVFHVLKNLDDMLLMNITWRKVSLDADIANLKRNRETAIVAPFPSHPTKIRFSYYKPSLHLLS